MSDDTKPNDSPATGEPSAEGSPDSTKPSSNEPDLPPGDLPSVPLWAAFLGFGLWAGWLTFLAVAAFMVRG